MMPDLLLCEQKKKNKKNLSEFWRGRGKTAPKAGWGWVFAGRSPKLERKGEKDDWLIYSEWVNQTLMAFGRASGSISALSLSHTRSYLAFSTLAALTSISSEIHFSMVAHKDETHVPPPNPTDKYALIPAQLVNQGALHAQWDKVNDRKIKREEGGDLLSQLSACLTPRQYLLH